MKQIVRQEMEALDNTSIASPFVASTAAGALGAGIFDAEIEVDYEPVVGAPEWSLERAEAATDGATGLRGWFLMRLDLIRQSL